VVLEKYGDQLDWMWCWRSMEISWTKCGAGEVWRSVGLNVVQEKYGDQLDCSCESEHMHHGYLKHWRRER
jgi:hypothetical protein